MLLAAADGLVAEIGNFTHVIRVLASNEVFNISFRESVNVDFVELGSSDAAAPEKGLGGLNDEVARAGEADVVRAVVDAYALMVER